MEIAQEVILRTQLIERRERLTEAIDTVSANAHLVTLLREVEAALERIDTGSYGICELCREPIEEEYLRVDPLVRTCLGHLSDEQRAAIERDLDLASQIQRRLLPPQPLSLHGWEVWYHYEPAGPVSGDYCDVVIPGNGAGDTFVLCGDVSGKGIAASLLMSQMHAMFHTLIPAETSLRRLVERANRLFCESTMATHFATLVCTKMSPDGTVELCNAGHCLPLVLRHAGVAPIESTGLPVGVSYSGRYDVQTLILAPGDTLLLYTDGVTETRDSADAEYGEQRLAELIARHYALPARDLVNACTENLRLFRGSTAQVDDVTIMAIRRTA